MAGLEIRSPSPTADLVLICVNPNAGSCSGKDQVEQLKKLLEQDGFRVEVISDLEILCSRAAAAMAEDRLRVVVAAGGDGTVSRLLNLTGPGTPLTILPLGTENLLSKYLAIRPEPESVANLIRQGLTMDLDVGRANGTLFGLMFSCGFDADVVQRLHARRRGHIRHLSYVRPIIESLFRYDFPEVRISWSGEDRAGAVGFTHSARWTFVVNLPCYAGGLKLAPDASGMDGLLDVCTFRRGSIVHGLRYLAGVVLGKHQGWADCVTGTTARLRVDSDKPVPYQLDGDPGGELPVEIDVLPGRLTIMMPAHAALAKGADARSSWSEIRGP